MGNSSDEDDDLEEDPDFDPTPSTNTPQENVSEEESDGDDEEAENENENQTTDTDNSKNSTPSRPPESRSTRKRPATVSSEESNGSVTSRPWKAPKLVSVNSSRPIAVSVGLPRTRIAFLSGKPSDIGLGGDLRKTGLGGVLAALRSQKQTKLTTLEKSRLDWQAFKQAEGLDDELKNQLKSRDGYLERRDFLERTDSRQFEIEKEMRARHRRVPS